MNKLPSLTLATVLLFPLASLQSAAADTAAQRPNILYIFTDQQFAQALSCAGNPWVKTPAMDSLSATAVQLRPALPCPWRG